MARRRGRSSSPPGRVSRRCRWQERRPLNKCQSWMTWPKPSVAWHRENKAAAIDCNNRLSAQPNHCRTLWHRNTDHELHRHRQQANEVLHQHRRRIGLRCHKPVHEWFELRSATLSVVQRHSAHDPMGSWLPILYGWGVQWDVPASGGNATFATTVYGRIFGNQQTALEGVYRCLACLPRSTTPPRNPALRQGLATHRQPSLRRWR